MTTALPKEITINDVKYVRADSVRALTAKGADAVYGGSIKYIGDEKLIEVYPHDLPETMTYLNTVKAVEKLGDGWRIPTLEELRLMYKNKDEIGGFCTSGRSGSGYPDWYWSSTENRDDSSYVHDVRFSDGDEDWNRKDYYRLSCRPVRLVAAAAPTPVGEEA